MYILKSIIPIKEEMERKKMQLRKSKEGMTCKGFIIINFKDMTHCTAS